MLVSLEGNIGSGKSTLLSELRKMTDGAIFKTASAIVFIDEPVSQWMNIEGVNMIERFYGEKQRYSFLFQVMAFVTRMEMLEDAMKSHQGAIFVTERSLFTDELFASMLHDDGLMDEVEFAIYKRLAARFDRVRPDMTLYLRTDPEVSFERCRIRGREGENISLEYLQQCHAKHEEWASVTKPMVLDATAPLQKNAQLFWESIFLKK